MPATHTTNTNTNNQTMKLYHILPALLLGAMLSSCEEDINIGKQIDEKPFAAATQLAGMLVDRTTNQNSSIVELHQDAQTVDMVFRLTQLPQKGVDAKVSIDPAYAEKYNSEHQTTFATYPADCVEIARDGVLLLAPDDKVSPTVTIRLRASESLQEDQTYIVPLTVATTTEGVTLTEASSHAVLLVQDFRNKPNCYKGPGAVKSVCYFEVNDVNPLNALTFLTESGKYFFDDVVLFAANINWDEQTKRVYVSNNENVQYLFDHNDQLLQPLRRAGMRVIVSILGNHDQSGVAQLSDMGCREFAREVAAYCRGYNIDGVALDDEYSNGPDLSNPWLAQRSTYAGSRLLYELKKAMPEKIVSIYNLGSIYSNRLETIDGIQPGQYLDYAVADYGQAAAPGAGMTLAQCGGMSIELARGSGNSSTAKAQQQKAAGYGYYMFFSLQPNNSYQFARMQTVCKGLYDEDLIAPTGYYAKNNPNLLH